MTYSINIPTANQRYSTMANSQEAYLCVSKHDRQLKMAAGTGKTYISETMKGTVKTRREWQSQTWGRPALQVRVQNQFQFQQDEIPLAVMAGRMKKFSENSSTIPEVMEFEGKF